MSVFEMIIIGYEKLEKEMKKQNIKIYNTIKNYCEKYEKFAHS